MQRQKCDDKCKDGDDKCHDDCKDDDKCDKHHCKYPYCEIHNTDCDLLITLCNGVLKDKRDATGEIAANHQFQFDKPPQRMPYTRKVSLLFTLKELIIWLLTTRSSSGIVKLTTKGYTRFMINLLVHNALKLNLLF